MPLSAATTGQLVIVLPSAGGTDDQTAAEVPSGPVGGVVATNVQDAIAELDAEHTVDTDTFAGISTLGDLNAALGSAVADGPHFAPSTITSDYGADSVALTTDTTGNYVASVTNGAGITGGDGGSEGAALTIAATLGVSIAAAEMADEDHGDVSWLSGVASVDDEAVAATELTDGTPGNLLTWDASGEAAVVATGSATQVLTSNGAGAAPTFQAAAGGGATTEAGLESDLTDVADVYTDNDPHAALTSTGIDADGDGTEELASSGTIVLDPDDDGVQDFIFTAGGASTDYIEFIETGSWGYVRAGPGNNGGLILQTKTGSAEVAFYPGAGNVLVFRVTASGVIALVPNISSPSTATCADSGDGSPGALFISATTSTSYVEITNSDADGCTVTVGEPGAGGQRLTLALVATSGGVITLSDTPGTINLSADWTPGLGDTLESIYSLTRSEWLQTARSDN
jgi:hypothetical protein